MDYHSFRIEAKYYKVVQSENGFQFKIEEKCKGRSRSILMGLPCLRWLQKVLGDLLREDGGKLKYSTKREANMAFIAQERKNLHGHFVEIVKFGNGGFQGMIVIPSGRNGSGWLTFVGKLKEITAGGLGFHGGYELHASRDKGGQTVERRQPRGDNPSFAEVVVRGRGVQQPQNTKAPKSMEATFLSVLEFQGSPEKKLHAAIDLLQRHRKEIDDLLNQLVNMPTTQAQPIIQTHIARFNPQAKAQLAKTKQAQHNKPPLQHKTAQPLQHKTHYKQKAPQMTQSKIPNINLTSKKLTPAAHQAINPKQAQNPNTQRPIPDTIGQEITYDPITQAHQTRPDSPSLSRNPQRHISDSSSLSRNPENQNFGQPNSAFHHKEQRMDILSAEPTGANQKSAIHDGVSLLHARMTEMNKLFREFQSFENTDMGKSGGEASTSKILNSSLNSSLISALIVEEGESSVKGIRLENSKQIRDFVITS